MEGTYNKAYAGQKTALLMAARLFFIGFILIFLSGCGLKIIAPSGRTVYEPGTSEAGQVVMTAKKQIGVRYRYGGSSPKGFDCSGLIWWAYRQHGIAVPRITRDQARYGREIAPAKIKPGDILVFRIGQGLHTGLYTGQGKFVHAPSSGKTVREDSVNTKYWRPRLQSIRRIISRS